MMTERQRYDHDVRKLMPGDSVEVYIEPDRAWRPGVFEVSTRGLAYVELPNGVMIGLATAMLLGMRHTDDFGGVARRGPRAQKSRATAARRRS